MKRTELTENRSRRNKIQTEKLVERVNSLTASEFFTAYYDNQSSSTLQSVCDTHEIKLICKDAKNMTTLNIDACFKLIEQSSAEDYKHSEMKWSPVKKRKEMLLPDMKYLMLLEKINKDVSEAAGFASFMVTYEDGYEVIYLYEIHLAPAWRGRGLGKLMMTAIENIGENVGVCKTMLTVFQSNQKAVQWYEHLGYSVDEFSPGPRKLRNGTVKEPTYLILSKPVQ